MIYKQINRHGDICFEMAFLQPLTKSTRKWHYGSKKIAIIIVRRFGPISTLYIILAMTIYKHSTSQFFIRFGLHFFLPQGKYQSKHSLMCLTHCQFFWHWSLLIRGMNMALDLRNPDDCGYQKHHLMWELDVFLIPLPKMQWTHCNEHVLLFYVLNLRTHLSLGSMATQIPYISNPILIMIHQLWMPRSSYPLCHIDLSLLLIPN